METRQPQTINEHLKYCKQFIVQLFFYNSTNLRFRNIYVSANENKPTAVTCLEHGTQFPPKLGMKIDLKPDIGKETDTHHNVLSP